MCIPSKFQIPFRPSHFVRLVGLWKRMPPRGSTTCPWLLLSYSQILYMNYYLASSSKLSPTYHSACITLNTGSNYDTGRRFCLGASQKATTVGRRIRNYLVDSWHHWGTSSPFAGRKKNRSRTRFHVNQVDTTQKAEHDLMR